MRVFLFWLFLFVSTVLEAQDTHFIDSLQKILSSANVHDTSKAIAMHEMAMQYYLSDPAKAEKYWQDDLHFLEERLSKATGKIKDSYNFSMAYVLGSLCYIAQNSGRIDEAIHYGKKSITLFTQIGDSKGIASTYNNLGTIYQYRGKADSALIYFKKAYQIMDSVGNKKDVAMMLNNIALVYYNNGNVPLALEYYHKSLKTGEAAKEYNAMGQALNNIGTLYSDQGDLRKAEEYFKKSLEVRTQNNDQEGIALSLNELGVLAAKKNKHDEALSYHLKSLDIRRKIKDAYGISQSLTNIGATYRDKKDYALALKSFTEALTYNRASGEKKGTCHSLNNIGNIYYLLKDYKNAEKYCLESLVLAKELKYPSSIRNVTRNLHKIFSATGKYKDAYEMQSLYYEMRDSINNEETQKSTFKQQMKFEYEKKEAIAKAEENRKEGVLKAELKNQKIKQYAITFGLLLTLIFTFFILRGYRQKQKANQLLALQKADIEFKNEELNQQNEEIAAQRDLIELQKSVVEEKQKEIVDSIHYAQRIQQARITSQSYINNYIQSENYFIFYQPKDIVSGDFYWAMEHNNIFYFITADCTGHGVPGAFMSLLNISYLDECLLEKKLSMPDVILNQVRDNIIKALNPDGKSTYKDGMDCTLMAFDFKQQILHVAAANNPLWLIRNAGTQAELIEIIADKMPVGLNEGESKSFTLQSVRLQEGDLIYSFTDGFADQFGGPKGKKFKYRQLKDLLLANSGKTMEQQKEIMTNCFEAWIGNLEQVDDVLVVGIKV